MPVGREFITIFHITTTWQRQTLKWCLMRKPIFRATKMNQHLAQALESRDKGVLPSTLHISGNEAGNTQHIQPACTFPKHCAAALSLSRF